MVIMTVPRVTERQIPSQLRKFSVIRKSAPFATTKARYSEEILWTCPQHYLLAIPKKRLREPAPLFGKRANRRLKFNRRGDRERA